jgi:hypothetical protein
MAIAIVREFDVGDDRGTPNYDAVSRKVDVESSPPEGMICHTAGFTDDGRFVIFDVWESAEAERRFSDERLGPALREVMGENPDGPLSREYSYELHHVAVPR